MKRTGVYVFKISNDDEGKQALRLLVKGFNKKQYTINLRGRHSRKKLAFELNGLTYRKKGTNDIPLSLAETIAVYIRPKPIK